MKKLLACLLAGVLSAGVFALSACDNGNNPDNDGESKYPKIPDGVNLSDVKAIDAVDKDAELLAKRNASNSVIQDQYCYLKEVYYNTDDGKETRSYENEIYLNLKYLNKDDKIYGENHMNSSINDVGTTFDMDNNAINYQRNEKLDKTSFVQNGSLGILYKGDFYSKSNENEDQDNIPLYLRSYAVNGVELASREEYYGGVRILSYAVNSEQRVILPYSGDDVRMNAEYKLTQQQDPTKLLGYIDPDLAETYWQRGDVKIKNYKSTLKTDGTKMFFEYSYRADFIDYNADKVYYSWEYKFATYLDTNATLTAGDFKENYVTDEVFANSFYYDCDIEKVGKDFSEGRDAVIDIVGGGDKPADGYLSFPERIVSIRYCDTESGGYTIAITDKYSFINGKLVIEAVDWEELDEQAEMLNGMFSDKINVATAKKYLIISNSYGRDSRYFTFVSLYIPLN